MSLSNHKNESFSVLLALGAVAAIAGGCASIGNPSGGPRDERPPRFISANPDPGSAGVSNHIGKISIRFDEIVNVKDPMTKVVVSPPSAQIPRVTALGRGVTVSFPDTLEPNTTYTIDFGNAIEDNNEGNQLQNFAYTFSTGPVVDSLRISGMVATARDLEPLQYKLVGIQRIPDGIDDGAYRPIVTDSLIFSRRFDRVAKTDERGRFSVEGIAPGRYRIYALDDTNNDFIYSSPTEEMAFMEEVIVPSAEMTSTTDTLFNLKTGAVDSIRERTRTRFLPNDILLRSSISRRQQQYIKKYERIDTTRLLIIMGHPMASLPGLALVDESEFPAGETQASLYARGITEKRAGNDSITFWLTDRRLISSDTLRVAITYQKLDSLNRYYDVTDTLRFLTDRAKLKREAEQKAKAAEQARKKAAKAAARAARNGSGEDGANPAEGADSNGSSPEETPHEMLGVTLANDIQEVNKPFSFETAAPLVRLDTAAFRLEMKVDTLWKGAPLPGGRPAIRQDTLNPRQYFIDYGWKAGTEYRLLIDSLAMESVYGLHSKGYEHPIKVRPDNEYASLKLNLADWPGEISAFVELLSSSGTEIVASRPVEGGVAYFPYLIDGKYYLRVIHDRNGNGRWDASDILAGEQADECYYYPKAINIKKNWNKEETWNVFSTPVDKMKPEAILRNKPAQRGRASQKKVEEEEDEEEM